MDNYFLVYNCVPNDMPYAIYIEGELWIIHKTFGHPSILATEEILRIEAVGDIDG